MTKRQFQATEGLLHDVMRKQAGSIEKAVLEAVMNSIDAGASEITIELEEDWLLVEDNGEGMTEEEVENYFEKFGLKDTDIEDKEFGKFRMGRGQIFNFGRNVWHSKDNILVVDLNHDQTTLTLDGEDHTLDTEGLSYNLLKSEDTIGGCSITVDLYSEIDDVVSKVSDIKKLIKYIPWFHDIDLTINGEDFCPEPEVDEQTEYAFYVLDGGWFGAHSRIFNKGAYVKDERLGPVKAEVITKRDLDLNFARNDIIEGDELWEQVVEDYNEVIQEYLIEEGDLSRKQQKWLIERAGEDPELLNRIKDKPLVKDVTGTSLTLEEISGEKVSFARSGDKVAEDAMKQSGIKMLDNTFEEAVMSFAGEGQVKDYEEVVEEEMAFEMKETKISELSKRRTENLFKVRWFLEQVGFSGDVKAGFSRHADCWKDGEGTLYVHRDLLNEKKDVFATDVLDEVMKVAAHDGDTRGGLEETYELYRQYFNYAKHSSGPRRKIIQGSADWEVKKKEWELEQARE